MKEMPNTRSPGRVRHLPHGGGDNLHLVLRGGGVVGQGRAPAGCVWWPSLREAGEVRCVERVCVSAAARCEERDRKEGSARYGLIMGPLGVGRMPLAKPSKEQEGFQHNCVGDAIRRAELRIGLSRGLGHSMMTLKLGRIAEALEDPLLHG